MGPPPTLGQLLDQQSKVHFQSGAGLAQLVVDLARYIRSFVLANALQARREGAQLLGSSSGLLFRPLPFRYVLQHG